MRVVDISHHSNPLPEYLLRIALPTFPISPQQLRSNLIQGFRCRPLLRLSHGESHLIRCHAGRRMEMLLNGSMDGGLAAVIAVNVLNTSTKPCTPQSCIERFSIPKRLKLRHPDPVR